MLEAEVSLTGDKWQKHPIVTDPEASCVLDVDCLIREYFKEPKGYWWVIGVPTIDTEKIKQLYTLTGLFEDLLFVGLLWVEMQQVPISSYCNCKLQHNPYTFSTYSFTLCLHSMS